MTKKETECCSCLPATPLPSIRKAAYVVIITGRFESNWRNGRRTNRREETWTRPTKLEQNRGSDHYRIRYSGISSDRSITNNEDASKWDDTVQRSRTLFLLQRGRDPGVEKSEIDMISLDMRGHLRSTTMVLNNVLLRLTLRFVVVVVVVRADVAVMNWWS